MSISPDRSALSLPWKKKTCSRSRAHYATKIIQPRFAENPVRGDIFIEADFQMVGFHFSAARRAPLKNEKLGRGRFRFYTILKKALTILASESEAGAPQSNTMARLRRGLEVRQVLECAAPAALSDRLNLRRFSSAEALR